MAENFDAVSISAVISAIGVGAVASGISTGGSAPNDLKDS